MVEGEQELNWAADALKGSLVQRLTTEPTAAGLDVKLGDLTVGQLLIIVQEVLRVGLELEARG